MPDENRGAEESAPEQIEKEARAIGWVPPEEFKGDPEKAIDAETFIKRQDTNLGAMRGKVDRQSRRIEELSSTVERQQADFAQQVQALEKMSEYALTEQRRKLEGDYKSRQRDAVEIGDTEAFDKLEQAKDDALEKFDTAAEEAKKKPEPKPEDTNGAPRISKTDQDTIEAWVIDNPWFNADPLLGDEAEAYHRHLLREQPGIGLEANLKEVRKVIESRYPGKFGKAPVTEGDDGDEDEDEDAPPSPYAGGARRASGATGGADKGWKDLPKPAKAQATKFIEKDGAFLRKDETIEKDLSKAQARYAEKYWQQFEPRAGR